MPGLHFDPGPLGLDLYRLLCLYLADRRVMSIAIASEEKLHEAPWAIASSALSTTPT